VILRLLWTLEATVLRETDPQTTIWELLLEEAKRLPAESARVDAYLNDERFIAPGGRCSGPAWAAIGPHRHAAAPAAPDAPLRVGLREPLPGGRRLDQLAAVLPHRPGPSAAASDHADQAGRSRRPPDHREAECRAASQAGRRQAAAGPQLWVDTTVVEADIDYPTDADLLELFPSSR
jgi:IS5 family transposase